MKTLLFIASFCMLLFSAGCRHLEDLTPMYEFPPEKKIFAVSDVMQTTAKADLIITSRPLLLYSAPVGQHADSSTIIAAKVDETSLVVTDPQVVSQKGVGFVAATPFNDGVLILGETHQRTNPFSGSEFHGFSLVFLDASGNLLWQERIIELAPNFKPMFLQVDNLNQEIYVEGYSSGFQMDEIVMIKFTLNGGRPSGRLLRETREINKNSIFAGADITPSRKLALFVATFERTGCSANEYGLQVLLFDHNLVFETMDNPDCCGKFQDNAFGAGNQYYYFAAKIEGRDSIAFMEMNRNTLEDEPLIKLPFSIAGISLTGLSVDQNSGNPLLYGSISQAPAFDKQMWIAHLDAGNGYDSLRTFIFGEIEDEVCRSARIGAAGQVAVAGSTGTGTMISPLALFFNLNE